jgi:hypothetical protein
MITGTFVVGPYMITPFGPIDGPAKDGRGHPSNGPGTGRYNPKIIRFVRCHDPWLASRVCKIFEHIGFIEVRQRVGFHAQTLENFEALDPDGSR